MFKRILILFVFFIFGQFANGQSDFLVPADTLNKKRFNAATIITATASTAISIGLYNVWYRQYEQEGFHFFNDWNEWNNMDKMGHWYTAYFQGVLTYKAAKWTGLRDDKAILTGMLLGTVFQTTVEMFDAFSVKWGFSIADIAYNTGGVAAFALQQKYWKEQRIQFKVSSYRRNYSTAPVASLTNMGMTSIETRADELFGPSFAERFLKDYNAQTLWASVNIHSFLPEGNQFPKWLNLAVGAGSENLFGGFENKWSSSGEEFKLDPVIFPRYRQFFIGLDIDLNRLPINNYYWKTFLQLFNIFKIPGPAIEINTQGQIKFHLLHF